MVSKVNDNDNEIERRAELAGKVTSLDERTHHITKAVDRIEKHLEDHTKREEAAIHHFYKTKAEMLDIVNDFKDAIDKKLDETVEKVEETVSPIREEVSELKENWSNIKFGWRIVIGILSTIGTLALFFKDHILKFFN